MENVPEVDDLYADVQASCHATKSPDDSGNEADGKAEYVLPGEPEAAADYPSDSSDDSDVNSVAQLMSKAKLGEVTERDVAQARMDRKVAQVRQLLASAKAPSASASYASADKVEQVRQLLASAKAPSASASYASADKVEQVRQLLASAKAPSKLSDSQLRQRVAELKAKSGYRRFAPTQASTRVPEAQAMFPGAR
jgi:hypothetical protein